MNRSLSKHSNWLYPLLVLVISFAIYFPFYGSPAAMFWDENYHIASAQKHVDGVMYMEPHPPLGKMLMAVGESLFGGNDKLDMSALNKTDYLKGDQMPNGMSFTGWRWPSTVMMLLSALFFYGIIEQITQRKWVALLFTPLIIFDNALVVHSRAAMLEGIQLCFILAALYWFSRVVSQKVYGDRAIKLCDYAVLGILIGLVVSVKLNGFVLLLLFVMLFGVDQWQAIKNWRIGELIIHLAKTVPSGVAPLALVFFAVFYIHIGMGKTVIDNRTYKASPEYLAKIKAGETWTPSTFLVGVKDNLRFISEYADGVPRLDECKVGENGSFALDWMVGKKTISYRWDRITQDGEAIVHYKYLVANPVVWFSVLAGIVLSVILIGGRYVYNAPIKEPRLFYWIFAFTTLYIAYMTAILQIERVMYMYHYMVPLIFGMINLALVFTYLFYDDVMQNRRHTMINLGIFAALVIGVFAFFSPFTYGFGLNEAQFELRNWFSFWKMQVVK